MKITKISELNSKPFYRLVKVAYIGFISLVLLVAVFGIYDEQGPKQTKDYSVTCNYGDKSSFYAKRDKNLYLFSYNPSAGLSSLSESDRVALQQACNVSNQELNDLLTAYIDKKAQLNPLFTLVETEYTKGDALAALGYIALTSLVVLAFGEFVRRLVYYIVLGSFYPEL